MTWMLPLATVHGLGRLRQQRPHKRLKRRPPSFALPDDRDPPAEGDKRTLCLLVPLVIALELGGPIVLTGSRDSGINATGVLVPEAAMDKDSKAVSRQHYVRPAGQIAAVKPKPKAEPVQRLPHHYFGLGVLRRKARHHLAARFVA